MGDPVRPSGNRSPIALPGGFCNGIFRASPSPARDPNRPRLLLLLIAQDKGPPYLPPQSLQCLWSWFREAQASAACVGVSGHRQDSYK